MGHRVPSLGVMEPGLKLFNSLMYGTSTTGPIPMLGSGFKVNESRDSMGSGLGTDIGMDLITRGRLLK